MRIDFIKWFTGLLKPKHNFSIKIPDDDKTSNEEINILRKGFVNDNSVYATNVAFDEFPDPIYQPAIKTSAKTLIVVDDLSLTGIILDDAFDSIKKVYSHHVKNDFNMLTCYNPYANFTMIKYIDGHTLIPPLNITHALLDLTLEHEVKLYGGEIRRYDGIALYEILKNKYPNIKVRFFSAHTIPVHIDRPDELAPTTTHRPPSYLKDGINAYIERFMHTSPERPTLAAYCISKSDPDSYKKIEEFLYGS